MNDTEFKEIFSEINAFSIEDIKNDLSSVNSKIVAFFELDSNKTTLKNVSFTDIEPFFIKLKIADEKNNIIYNEFTKKIFHDLILDHIEKIEKNNIFFDNFIKNYKDIFNSSAFYYIKFQEFNLEKTKFLLNFLNEEQLIISLFFTLAYNYRSVPKKNVSKEYFNMWRNKLNKIDIKNFSNNFMYNFMEEVTYPNSNISYFISSNFIKWLWKSLFIEFDETLLNEFFVFDSRKERFSLEYYFIFRILVSSETFNLEKKANYSDNFKEAVAIAISCLEDLDKYHYNLFYSSFELLNINKN